MSTFFVIILRFHAQDICKRKTWVESDWSLNSKTIRKICTTAHLEAVPPEQTVAVKETVQTDGGAVTVTAETTQHGQ